MSIPEQIESYIIGQPEPKPNDMIELHTRILQISQGSKLWFDNGKNSENRTISNPSIGYGVHRIKYADGKTREYYQVGLSANTTGISIYILGIEDKTYLSRMYRKELGKASVSGYCIKFKHLKDININVLEDAMRYGFDVSDDN